MAQNDAGFVGSMPQFYDTHMGNLLFQPYADDIAARLAGITQGRLLETAAGTGIVTATLAAKLPPTVEITATDLNQPMLDFAKGKPGMDRVTFQQAEAQALPFADAAFDVLVCQFGVMFFPDKAQGFREAYRVLKPGGQLIFNVWDNRAANPMMDAVIVALEQRYPAHPSWFMERTPMGYRDQSIIRADMQKGGFTDASFETLARPGRAPSPEGPAMGLCQGSPLRAEIEAIDPGGLADATKAVAAGIAQRCGKGAFETILQAVVITARK